MDNISDIRIDVPEAIRLDLSQTKAPLRNTAELRQGSTSSGQREVIISSGFSGRVWKAPVVHKEGQDELQALALEEVASQHTLAIATTLALVTFGASDAVKQGETMITLDSLAKIHNDVPKEALINALRTVAVQVQRQGNTTGTRYYQIRRDTAIKHVQIENIPDSKKKAREEIATLAVKKLAHPNDIEDRNRFLPFADGETKEVFAGMTSGIMSGFGSKSTATNDASNKRAESSGSTSSSSSEDEEEKAQLYKDHKLQSNYRLPTTLMELELDDGVTWAGVGGQMDEAKKQLKVAKGFVATKVVLTKDIHTREEYAQQEKLYKAMYQSYNTMVEALDAFQGISERAKEWLETPAARHEACQTCRMEMQAWFRDRNAVASKVDEGLQQLHRVVGAQRVLLCEVRRLHNLGILDQTW